MTFITDRALRHVQAIASGSTDEYNVSRGTLRPQDFQRWKTALLKINNKLQLPDITEATQMNCTNPTIPITGATYSSINDCWYYWKAVDDLRKQLPENVAKNINHFPTSLENLTFSNVNAIESVIEYFYNTLNN